jgi:SAM-dependent methyltransferase
MRKDYLATSDAHGDETAFVEDYWTRVWEREGGPKGAMERIPKKDEYRIMAPYLDSLAPGARILDGGCGLGDWVLALTKRGFSVVGMDISRQTVSQLQERFPETPFVAGDIRATAFADGEFDVYYSWGVFEHFEAGPQDCLKEAWRILKPGGLLFISVPLDNLRQAVLGSLANASEAKANMRFYQYRFTRAELGREIGMAGFELADIHPIHKRQGVLRSLHHELGLRYEWFLTKALSALVAPVIPGWAIAHMTLAVARKRG